MSFIQRRLFVRSGLSVAIALAVSAGASSSFAEEVYELDQVVVTAARTAQTVDETLAPVTVITREDIERSQADSVPEILSSVPGMQISNSGGMGGKPGVYLRGTRSAQTLILLDGQKINTANDGEAPLQYIDPNIIERIEIVRGPRSSLYGADAIGGVIQLFTRKGTSEPKISIKAGAGSNSTSEYGITATGKQGGTSYTLGVNYVETSGYDHTLNETSGDDDDDLYRNESFFGSLTKEFSEDLKAGLTVSHAEGKSEYDNGYNGATSQPYYIYRLTNLSTFSDYSVNEIWSNRLGFGYSEFYRLGKSEDNTSGIHSDSFYSEVKRYSVSWMNDVNWSESQFLTTGIDYSNELYDGSSEYMEDTRSNTGVFIQNRSIFENSDLEISLRNDENEAYGNKSTGGIVYGYDFNSDLRLTASYGTAFRAPTFADLYYPGYEKPNLKPELSEQIEVGLKGRVNSRTYWSINVYQNDMKDMLLWSSDGMENIEKAKITGVEFVAGSNIAGWDVNANVTYLNPENRSDDNKGKVLIYRAKQLLNINLDKQFDALSLGATFRAQGKSYKDADNKSQTEVNGFGTVDLRASLQLSKELKAGMKVVNLMDRDYQTVFGYRAEPRAAYVTLTWTPAL